MTNTFEFSLGLVNFVLLLVGLKFILIDPMKKVVREREEAAKRDIKEAEDILAEAKGHLANYKSLMDGLEAEKEQIRKEALEKASQVKVKTAELSQKEALQTVARAKGEAETERREAVRQIRSMVAESATSKAKDMLEKSLDEPTRQNIIENFLAKVGAENAK